MSVVILSVLNNNLNTKPITVFLNGDRGVSVAANTILISTVLSAVTISGWLFVLSL